MQPSVRKKSWMNRFIDTIEYWGNKLPHPFILFGMLVVITLIGSWILSQAGCSITYMAASRTPGEPEKEVTIAVTNLLSGENLRYLITKYPDIFIGYPPMKLVLVMMAATAFIEKTGFFGTFMKKYLLRAPRSLVTFAVVFVGVNSNLMSDAGTLFALTMGGIIFAALGRNPLIGVILGWASSSGGFTANLFLAGTDALLAGITEGVVKEMGVAVDINPAMNYFFMASATFFLSVTLTLFTEKVVCRMVGDGDGKVNMALLEEHKLTADQEKRTALGFLWISLLPCCYGSPYRSFLGHPAQCKGWFPAEITVLCWHHHTYCFLLCFHGPALWCGNRGNQEVEGYSPPCFRRSAGSDSPFDDDHDGSGLHRYDE